MINNLHKRILEICYKNKISHIGSSICAVNIINEIYKNKREEDICILSQGHAGLALYCVLEKYYGFNAEELFKKHGLHPHRDINDKIYCSTGSLGQGITVGIGMALADKSRKIYVLCSDGEVDGEGSVWEALSFVDRLNIENIEIIVNINGFAAYREINKERLTCKLKSFYPKIKIIYTDFQNIPFLNGLDAHYKIMSEEDYKTIK